jgi:hypothetical protein
MNGLSVGNLIHWLPAETYYGQRIIHERKFEEDSFKVRIVASANQSTILGNEF